VPWQAGDRAGVEVRPLYSQAGFDDSMRLERWRRGGSLGQRTYPRGAELFVLRGAFEDEQGRFAEHAWLRLPPRAAHAPATRDGCELYIKEGGFAYLTAG
jgi:anti-sigma factor ChrR (cupin superfamily)